MDIFIILFIIAAFFVVLTSAKSYIPFINKEDFQNIKNKCKNKKNIYKLDNFPNKNNNKLNVIENNQYYFKKDCIWNDECELKPNNFNFFQYGPKKTAKVSALSHNMKIDKSIERILSKSYALSILSFAFPGLYFSYKKNKNVSDILLYSRLAYHILPIYLSIKSKKFVNSLPDLYKFHSFWLVSIITAIFTHIK